MEQRVHPEAHSSRNYSDASILKMRVRIIPKKREKERPGALGSSGWLAHVLLGLSKSRSAP
jgi:hypothetical protein